MKKGFRLVLISLAILIILLVASQVFVSVFLPNVIRQRIINSVDQASHGLYAVNIDKVTTNIFQMSVGIHHAQFGFQNNDTSFINSYPHLLWKGTIDHAEVSGFNLIQFLISKKIAVQGIALSGSDLEMIQPTHPVATDSSFQQKNLQKGNFPSITIAHLTTHNTSFTILNLLHDTLPAFQTKDIEIDMKNVTIDSSVVFLRHQLFDASEATAILRKIQFITPDSLFKLSIPKIQFSYGNNNVLIDSLQFSPRYDRKEFLKRIPVEKDYLTISVNHIKLEKTNIKRLLEAKELLASKIVIDSMHIYSYRDKNISDNKRMKPMPQELLYKCPFLLMVDSVFVNNASATYQERTCDAQEAGKVWFSDINGIITHLTNDSVNSKNDTLKISATAMLMGEGKVNAAFFFPLFDPSLRFYSHGTIGSMNFTSLNPMLEMNADVSIKSGVIKHLEYTMTADKVRSTGEVQMIYDHLDIVKISKEDKNGSSVVNKAVSFITGLIVKKNSAPIDSEVNRETMEWQRDPTRSIFNYTWKTLWSGVKKTMGLPSNKTTTIGETTCP